MSMTDPIADMLTRIRNANIRKHPSVAIPYSRVKKDIADVLKAEGYIEGYEVVENAPQNILRVSLKYMGGRRELRPMITKIVRVSKPGRRVYVGKADIPWVLQGMGIAIMTTSRGMITGQEARRLGVGGEIVCQVY